MSTQDEPTEDQDSSQSLSSPSGSSSGSLVVERTIAIVGAIALRWFGKLDQEWAALVLASAFSAPLLARVMRVIGSKGK